VAVAERHHPHILGGVIFREPVALQERARLVAGWTKPNHIIGPPRLLRPVTAPPTSVSRQGPAVDEIRRLITARVIDREVFKTPAPGLPECTISSYSIRDFARRNSSLTYGLKPPRLPGCQSVRQEHHHESL